MATSSIKFPPSSQPFRVPLALQEASMPVSIWEFQRANPRLGPPAPRPIIKEREMTVWSGKVFAWSFMEPASVVFGEGDGID